VKREDLDCLPAECGVYILKDGEGRVLYVGKAVNILKRVKSHFYRASSPLKEGMLEAVASVQYFVTGNEHEALLLEEDLIKRFRPPYNLRLRDDKSYPYILFEAKGDFPAVRFARRKTGGEGVYFGPFTDSRKTREGLKLLRSIFRLRGCTIPESSFPLRRPCIDFELGLCGAPCVGHMSRAEYQENFRKAVDFLNGKYEEIARWIEDEMWKAADALDFERAIYYREKLEALQKVATRYRLVLSQPEDVDFVEVVCDEEVALFVVLRVRRGRLIGSESFVASSLGWQSKEALLREFLEQIYLHAFHFPRRVCVAVEHLEVLRELSEFFPFTVTPPYSGEEEEMMFLALENAQRSLEAEVLRRKKRERASTELLRGLQDLLGLPSFPRLVEGVDISTFQGEEAVGVVVAFLDGVPYPKRYRKFIVKSEGHPDDFGMMREVLVRHFRRLQSGEGSLPDLLLLDGGRGQLNVALGVFRELGVSCPVLALAKEFEEVYLPGRTAPLVLPPHSEVLQFLQRVRNEAHRFAVTFHRVRRNKKSFGSLLEEIEGIGPKRREKILAAFEDLRSLCEADPEEVSRRLRIPREVVTRLKERLQEVYQHGLSGASSG